MARQPRSESTAAAPAPGRAVLRAATLAALMDGLHDSDAMRARIAARLGVAVDSAFTNAHAWALVDLQAAGRIIKRGCRDYILGGGDARHEVIEAPGGPVFPPWARVLVARANRINEPNGPRFAAADLVALWQACGGRCAVTRLAFSGERIGASLVKRAYAPSLDRIVAGAPYTRANCRLVMVAVNFAMNAWGQDVYLRLARAAVEAQPA